MKSWFFMALALGVANAAFASNNNYRDNNTSKIRNSLSSPKGTSHFDERSIGNFEHKIISIIINGKTQQDITGQVCKIVKDQNFFCQDDTIAALLYIMCFDAYQTFDHPCAKMVNNHFRHVDASYKRQDLLEYLDSQRALGAQYLKTHQIEMIDKMFLLWRYKPSLKNPLETPLGQKVIASLLAQEGRPHETAQQIMCPRAKGLRANMGWLGKYDLFRAIAALLCHQFETSSTRFQDSMFMNNADIHPFNSTQAAAYLQHYRPDIYKVIMSLQKKQQRPLTA